MIYTRKIRFENGGLSLGLRLFPDERKKIYINRMELAVNGSGEAQLDVSGFSEKERILVGRKEIMVKFKKDGKPYKLTFHCVADGRIAGDGEVISPRRRPMPYTIT